MTQSTSIHSPSQAAGKPDLSGLFTIAAGQDFAAAFVRGILNRVEYYFSEFSRPSGSALGKFGWFGQFGFRSTTERGVQAATEIKTDIDEIDPKSNATAIKMKSRCTRR